MCVTSKKKVLARHVRCDNYKCVGLIVNVSIRLIYVEHIYFLCMYSIWSTLHINYVYFFVLVMQIGFAVKIQRENIRNRNSRGICIARDTRTPFTLTHNLLANYKYTQIIDLRCRYLQTKKCGFNRFCTYFFRSHQKRFKNAYKSTAPTINVQ